MRVIVVFMLTLFFSCSDNSEEISNTNVLKGKWTLVNHECCDSPTENYKDDITWVFNDETVTITNDVNFDELSQYSFKENGAYSFSIEDTNITIVYRNENRQFDFTAKENELILFNNPESDGSTLIFKR